jgi:hypothetical protein
MSYITQLAATASSQSYGTAQKAYFSPSTWTLPNWVLEGSRVSRFLRIYRAPIAGFLVLKTKNMTSPPNIRIALWQRDGKLQIRGCVNAYNVKNDLRGRR